MRIVELAGLELIRQPGGEVPEQGVLAMPDGKVLVLSRGGDDLDEASWSCWTDSC